MVILPRQLHTSASALDTKGLGLDSEEFSQICEKSLTWRGKDSQSRTWLQRWKRESWMQRLCSRTLNPSLTKSFVDAWTSSLEDSRANPSALLESVRALKTQDTSSPLSETESESANPELFSSKMWKESSQPKPQMANQFSSMSSASWKAWVTARRREYSQRLKSVHLTRESESSSLQVTWRTPQSQEPGISIERLKGGLDGARAYDKETGRLAQYGLTQQVQNWPTASARDWKDTAGMSTERDGKALGRVDQLPRAVYHHDGQPDRPTPSTTGKSRESWPTPRANKLNPNWVEHLMGLPVGWTDLGCWETE